MFKILINGLQLTRQYSGVNYTAAYLLEAIGRLVPPHFEITLLVYQNYNGELLNNNRFHIKRFPLNNESPIVRIAYENLVLPFFLKKNKYQLYHSLAYLLPVFMPTQSIVTVHDLIALDYPWLCKYSTAVYYNLCLPAAVKKAKKVITVSDAVTSDVLRTFGKDISPKVVTIYHGLGNKFKPVVDTAVFNACRLKYNLPGKFVLYVGNLEPKKNLKAVLKCYQVLINEYGLQHKLVIVGKKGWKYASFFRLINEAALGNKIIFTGYAADEDIPTLYSLADVCLLPSLYEGFGLPVIEAMACGCPVIVSDRGALPEISGEITTPLAPDDVAGMAAQVYSLITDLDYRNTVVKKGLNHSATFSWNKAAVSVIQVYEDCLPTARQKQC